MMSVDEQHSKQEKEIKIMAYKRKTVDCYAIEGNCGYGWDIECYCEDIADAKKQLKAINGYNEETLLDILYVRTGNRSVEQFLEEIEL